MAEELSAVAMVAYFGGCVAQLRGRAVYVQFSNHKELKTDQTHSNAKERKSSAFTLFNQTSDCGAHFVIISAPLSHRLTLNASRTFFAQLIL
ncbi:Polypyrimidine tract-binding protein 2 [Eumeta japonica]|uniref:Polypyrimidine tract-binding protein 2 n=1 Tax=Eumeta variegata TaxID=151549 RepID=A0A4C1X4H0_EUMVA|nr:Polypyrimidine tract-binding protein 2 [Eumeta japonica]